LSTLNEIVGEKKNTSNKAKRTDAGSKKLKFDTVLTIEKEPVTMRPYFSYCRTGAALLAHGMKLKKLLYSAIKSYRAL
jgi:hypothetical protein